MSLFEELRKRDREAKEREERFRAEQRERDQKRDDDLRFEAAKRDADLRAEAVRREDQRDQRQRDYDRFWRVVALVTSVCSMGIGLAGVFLGAWLKSDSKADNRPQGPTIVEPKPAKPMN